LGGPAFGFSKSSYELFLFAFVMGHGYGGFGCGGVASIIGGLISYSVDPAVTASGPLGS